MKKYYDYLILLLIINIVAFCSCVNKTNDKKEKYYNGIDSQILNIVDSMSVSKDRPFITVWFTMCNDSDCVVRFLNTLLIPAPDPPPAPIKKKIISDDDDFKGYKKYDSIYLIFLESNPNGYFDKFVKRDSLCFGEELFTNFKVYEYNRKCTDCMSNEKKYLINEKDSLVFYDRKCMFDIE